MVVAFSVSDPSCMYSTRFGGGDLGGLLDPKFARRSGARMTEWD